jgi:membrane protein
VRGRWARRLAGFLAWRPVVLARAVLARYGAAGGSLLAGGLAYSALFAIVPLTALLVGIIGLVVTDEARREAMVTAITSSIPPLHDVVQAVLDQLAGAAGAISVVGTAVLAWSASRFVVAFQDAIERVFGGKRRRGVLARNVAALGAVLGLIGVAVLGAVLTGLASVLEVAQEQAGLVVDVIVGPVLALVPPATAALSIVLVYRFVPASAPRWRSIAIPAVAVGLALTVLTRLFVFLAPRLVGSAAAIGALATAFAALAWLGLSFQAILLGAAWVRELDVARRARDEAIVL